MQHRQESAHDHTTETRGRHHHAVAMPEASPGQLGGGSGKRDRHGGELVAKGTVTSLPLYPWIALTVFALLARSRRWWGTIAVVVLCLLGALFIFGGLGEAFAPYTPYVPRAVLIAAGVVYGGLGLALVLSGIADLIDRVRARRQPSHVR